MFRPSRPEDWEGYRDVITDLYGSKKLKDVMKDMERHYYFKATYENYLFFLLPLPPLSCLFWPSSLGAWSETALFWGGGSLHRRSERLSMLTLAAQSVEKSSIKPKLRNGISTTSIPKDRNT